MDIQENRKLNYVKCNENSKKLYKIFCLYILLYNSDCTIIKQREIFERKGLKEISFLKSFLAVSSLFTYTFQKFFRANNQISITSIPLHLIKEFDKKTKKYIILLSAECLFGCDLLMVVVCNLKPFKTTSFAISVKQVKFIPLPKLPSCLVLKLKL